jgi:uncharacterized SAM-binding protein YcdF (DUF218 family)
MGRRPRVGRLLVGLSLGTLWLFSTPTVGYAIYRLAEAYPALKPDAPVAAGAIVILGGDIGWERLAYGAALARRTALPVLISSDADDARHLADVLESSFGIQARWVDQNSHDTFENARQTAGLLRDVPISRIVLVTHSSHMGRAVEEFEAAGFTVLPAPVAVNPRTDPGFYAWLPDVGGLLYSNLGLRELIGRPISTVLRRWRN